MALSTEKLVKLDNLKILMSNFGYAAQSNRNGPMAAIA
jgi:hypothetical protein